MLFFKKQIVTKIPDNACWGHLVNHHKVDVDTLSNALRCVKKEGVINGIKVTCLRIFNHKETERRGIEVKSWETFDVNPDLVAFEGYIDEASNKAVLERKNF